MAERSLQCPGLERAFWREASGCEPRCLCRFQGLLSCRSIGPFESWHFS